MWPNGHLPSFIILDSHLYYFSPNTQVLGELLDDEMLRKDLESVIGRLKSSHLSPVPSTSSAISTPNTTKKNLLGRVKSNRCVVVLNVLFDYTGIIVLIP